MKVWIITLLSIIFLGGSVYLAHTYGLSMSFSQVEAGFEDLADLPVEISEDILEDDLELQMILATTSRGARWAFWWREFTPSEKQKYENVISPEGPKRVGIQAGHWRNSEVPEELEGLKRNGGGASGGGKREVDVVLQIAEKVKILLEKEGVLVDLLPATVPPDYLADAFVSIHADGNTNTSVSGFKIAGPQRDFSGKSETLARNLRDTYKKATGLSEDSNITRRMSAYYAFNWRRYEHALHPMTPAVIVETGFLTSPSDRKIIVNNQDKVAKGIVDGVLNFLNNR